MGDKRCVCICKPGEIVTVNGTADVFGDNLDVTATVRVAEETIEIGDSVSGAAKLSQDIPEDKQSDTLEAIKNGSTTIGANTSGGKIQIVGVTGRIVYSIMIKMQKLHLSMIHSRGLARL